MTKKESSLQNHTAAQTHVTVADNLPVTPDHLVIDESLRPTAEKYMRGLRDGIANNTKIAIMRVLRQYVNFCYTNHFMMFPLDEDVVLRFIDDRLLSGVLIRTAQNDISLLKAIDAALLNVKESGIHNSKQIQRKLRPGFDKEVALSDAHNAETVVIKKDRPASQAYPIHFMTIQNWFNANADRHEDFDFIRNYALFLVAYDGMLRISEMEQVDIDHVNINDNLLYIPCSKNDQDGEGTFVYLSDITVAAVKDWQALLADHDLNESALFWGFYPAKTMRLRGRLTIKGIEKLVKKEFGSQCSGHSFRVGSTQDQASMGISNRQIMDSGRWNSEVMVSKYTRMISPKASGQAEFHAMLKKGVEPKFQD
jgi:integrase